YSLKSDALRSFFSGHALDAVLNLVIFPAFSMVCTRLQQKKRELQIAALVLIPPIVFSRMVLGAHYLSDVSAGMLCGLGFVLLYEFLVCRMEH
nr:phosphatase PAP2 family protein [Oscillospiraceae bacterium]